jgi:transcriptional regulator with XRE-family HTH domain
MNGTGTLRLLRERLNLSIQEVADATGLSFRTILRAEQGAPLNPDSRRQLCQFYGKTPEELSLVPRR